MPMDSLLESALNAAALRPDGVQPHTTAFKAGYEAYENGDEVWQNAYTEGEDAEEWREGWLQAAEDYVREAESNDADKILDDPRRGQARSINRS